MRLCRSLGHELSSSHVENVAHVRTHPAADTWPGRGGGGRIHAAGLVAKSYKATKNSKPNLNHFIFSFKLMKKLPPAPAPSFMSEMRAAIERKRHQSPNANLSGPPSSLYLNSRGPALHANDGNRDVAASDKGELKEGGGGDEEGTLPPIQIE